MNELEMAHDYAKLMLRYGDDESTIPKRAFDLVDAMKAEQIKHQRGIPEAIRDKPEQCVHLSTTLFVDGKAKCFMCGATVNTNREVIQNKEQQINKGARLTKHQIDLGDKNANS